MKWMKGWEKNCYYYNNITNKPSIRDNAYTVPPNNDALIDRNIPLFSPIPYLKDWIDQHPQTGNPNSPSVV
jgi:hypothetical protein